MNRALLVTITLTFSLALLGDAADLAAQSGVARASGEERRGEALALLEPCAFVAVFAHPDDETFATGTIAKLSAKDVCVQLVYATSGDAGGDLTGRGLRGAALGAAREQEMQRAAAVLGVARAPLFLRYPDGRVDEHRGDVLRDVEVVLEKTRPDVVLTFGPDGYYGHADHLAISQIAGRAFDGSGVADQLLHVALSRSTNDLIVAAGGGDRYLPVADKFITYTVDVTTHLRQRVDSMRAHQTQFAEETVHQFQQLATLRGREEFVEARHLGQSGSLTELFSN